MTIKVFRGGVWVDAPIKLRRGGVWVDAPVFVRRSGAWVRVNPPPALAASLHWNGQNPCKVSGASGTAAAYTDGGTYYPNVVALTVTGGTPEYDIVYSTSNPKVFAANSGDGIHTTVGYSGLALNETATATITASVTDSAHVHKSASMTISVKRTS